MTDDTDSPRYQYSTEHRERVLDEVLGDVDAYTASERGPDGPWYYKSLTIRRQQNTLHVFDVDGQLARMIAVADLTEMADDAQEQLAKKLESINSETMAEL